MLFGLRLLVAAIFLWSGISKLLDPVFFMIAMEAFEFGLPHALVRYFAFLVPWVEIVAATFLLVGRWVRPASFVIAIMMIVFSLAIVSLEMRGLDVECPCFGTIEFLCRGPMGTCHYLRNGLFLIMAIAIMRMSRATEAKS